MESGDKIKIKCFECGENIVIGLNKTKECSNCTSKNYLIENKYGLLKLIKQGGQGRIFKSIHLKTNKIVAIKERLVDDELQK